MAAAESFRQGPEPAGTQGPDQAPDANDSRPAANGEPATRSTMAPLLRPALAGEGWSKAAMVELRGFEPLTPSMPSTGPIAVGGHMPRSTAF